MIIHFGSCCLSTASKSATRPDKEVLYVLPKVSHEIVIALESSLTLLAEAVKSEEFAPLLVLVYLDSSLLAEGSEIYKQMI